jgi:restriction system protein
MALPDYQTLMFPVLRLAGDQQEHRLRDAIETLAVEFNLSDSDRAELLPSGSQPVFDNRVGWASTYLKQAGLLESTRRGFFRITRRGLDLLAAGPTRVDTSVLAKFAEFRAFKARRRKRKDKPFTRPIESSGSGRGAREGLEAKTPDDQMAEAYEALRADLEARLLDQLKQSSPAFFERVVVDLLVAMGYGGSRKEAGRAIGKSGDGGIDGIIDQDRLGLDMIYVQAKRWDGVVHRPEIQKFAGALQGKRARKGVFITTSGFSKGAVEYAALMVK